MLWARVAQGFPSSGLQNLFQDIWCKSLDEGSVNCIAISHETTQNRKDIYTYIYIYYKRVSQTLDKFSSGGWHHSKRANGFSKFSSHFSKTRNELHFVTRQTSESHSKQYVAAERYFSPNIKQINFYNMYLSISAHSVHTRQHTADTLKYGCYVTRVSLYNEKKMPSTNT